MNYYYIHQLVYLLQAFKDYRTLDNMLTLMRAVNRDNQISLVNDIFARAIIAAKRAEKYGKQAGGNYRIIAR